MNIHASFIGILWYYLVVFQLVDLDQMTFSDITSNLMLGKRSNLPILQINFRVLVLATQLL